MPGIGRDHPGSAEALADADAEADKRAHPPPVSR